MDHYSSLQASLVSLPTSRSHSMRSDRVGRESTPSRTLTCTLEYPFVTFFTLRMTFDILATDKAGAGEDGDERRQRSRRETDGGVEVGNDVASEKDRVAPGSRPGAGKLIVPTKRCQTPQKRTMPHARHKTTTIHRRGLVN